MNYLKHHGIPNQKWGERNGPPYPLSREEHNKVVRTGDVKTLKENITEFNDWEIEETLKRYDYNKKIEELIGTPEVKKGENITDKYISTMNRVGSIMGATVHAAEYSVKAYNIVANTMNSLAGKHMKTISMGGGKNNDNNKNDNKR